MLAQQYHLPQEIQDIIIEHHGDTPVMYFYHKALKQADVLMLPYLFPERFSAEQIRQSYDFYYPYTTHDSSLSA